MFVLTNLLSNNEVAISIFLYKTGVCHKLSLSRTTWIFFLSHTFKLIALFSCRVCRWTRSSTWTLGATGLRLTASWWWAATTLAMACTRTTTCPTPWAPTSPARRLRPCPARYRSDASFPPPSGTAPRASFPLTDTLLLTLRPISRLRSAAAAHRDLAPPDVEVTSEQTLVAWRQIIDSDVTNARRSAWWLLEISGLICLKAHGQKLQAYRSVEVNRYTELNSRRCLSWRLKNCEAKCKEKTVLRKK
jgi:hypothetical protein